MSSIATTTTTTTTDTVTRAVVLKQFDEYDLPAGSEQTQDAVREWLGTKRDLAKHMKTVLGLLDPVRLGWVFGAMIAPRRASRETRA